MRLAGNMEGASLADPGVEPASGGGWQTVWKDRRVRAVLVLALIIRLIFLGYLSIYPAGIFAKGDSKDYLQLAQYLLYYHAFGREEQMFGPGANQKPIPPPTPDGKKIVLIPETFRTPAYPAFVALIYGVTGSPFPAVVVQSLFSLLTVWLTILLTARLFRPEAAWLAGLLAALNPLDLTYSHQLMTESLFLLLVVFGVYSFITTMTANDQNRPKLRWSIMGGLAIGLATLTRPVGIYFPIFLSALWIIGVYGGVWQRLASREPEASLTARFASGGRAIIIFLILSLLLPALWAARNYHYHNRFLVSSSSDYNLLVTITSHIVAKVRNPEGNISSWDIYNELDKQLTETMASQGLKTTDAEKSVYFRNWSLKVIRDHLGLFIQYYFKGMVILFIPDVPGFFELCGVTTEGKGALGAVFRQGLRPALLRYFGEHWPFWIAAAIPLILFDLGVDLLALLGIAALWRARRFSLLFVILSIIGYWLAIAAVGAAPRYRLPLMPFLLMLSAWGLFQLLPQSKVRGRHAAVI